MDDPGGDGELALHALGVAAELAVGRLGQAERSSSSRARISRSAFAHAVQRRAEAQVVEAGQFGIEVALVRNHADQVLGRLGIARAVDPADAGSCPASGRARPVSMLMVVVLPAPLGPRKPNSSPSCTSKAQIRNGLHFTESLGQSLNGNGHRVR